MSELLQITLLGGSVLLVAGGFASAAYIHARRDHKKS